MSTPHNTRNAGPTAAVPIHAELRPEALTRIGRYRIERPLGVGGMGAVYLGHDDNLRRRVALKVMLPGLADPVSRQRFLREARAAAAIRSDHVVTIYEVGEEDDRPFIAMEYLHGQALDDLLRQNTPLTLDQILRIGAEIASGLAAAHALGLVHRDIKPANLWLEAPSGRVKLLDFGLARTSESGEALTISGAVIGTPAFMSPEQARGERLDGRSDLFSLGSVLYRLLTGRVPFQGPNVMATLTALAVDEIVPVRQINPSVPEVLAALVEQLLSKNAGARPDSAMEVEAALRGLLTVPVRGRAATRTGPNEAFADLHDSNTQAVSIAGRPAELSADRPRRLGWLWVGVASVLLLASVSVAALLLSGARPSATVASVPAEPSPTPQIRKPTPTPFLPKPDRERNPLERLRLSCSLEVKLGGGKIIRADHDTPLPNEPFQLTGLTIHGQAPDNTRELVLQIVAESPELTWLNDPFGKIHWQDGDIARIGESRAAQSLTSLRSATLELTPAVVDTLKNWPRLKRLALSAGKADDDLVVRLTKDLPGLTEFSLGQLSGSTVTRRGVEAIAQLLLTRLALSGVDHRIDRDGCRAIGRMTDLSELAITEGHLDDNMLAELAVAPQLTDLSLRRSLITDAGLERLAGMRTLRVLNVVNTRVSKAGVEKLATALPACRIQWTGGVIEPTAK